MTRDPERLLSVASEADVFERELLVSLRDARAPASVRRAAWQGIAAGLVAAAPASAAAAGAALAGSSGAALSGSSGAMSAAVSSAAGTAGTMAGGSIAPVAAVGSKVAVGLATKAAALLLTKWALVGVIGAGAVGGALWAAERGTDANEKRLQLKAAAPASATPSPPKQREPEAATAPSEQPAAAVVRPPMLAERTSSRHRLDALAAESGLLQNARAELRRGNLDEAGQALTQLSRRFPRGVLNQERDVLRIELLSARGDVAGARRLAARFLRAHPESPHAAQLRPLAPAP
jgi:hypothetical protein